MDENSENCKDLPKIPYGEQSLHPSPAHIYL